MRLVDLNPEFVGNGGPGILDRNHQPVPRREGVMISFDCPKCSHEDSERHGGIACYINPAMDGQPPRPGMEPCWDRTGDTFETMTLRPSVLNRTCGAHFYITDGEIQMLP